MNESSLTQTFQNELKRRKFFVIKHTDRFVKGVPDTSASRNHKTLWFEFKIIKVKRFLTELDWNRVIDKSDMVQLATMVKLQQAALAFYVLFQVIEGQGHCVNVLGPSQVLHSIKTKRPVPLGTAVTMQEIGEWI